MADLFTPTHLLIIFVGFPIFIVPFWRIFKKAGFAPVLSLLVWFPLIGLIVLYYVAFSDWKAAGGAAALPPPKAELGVRGTSATLLRFRYIGRPAINIPCSVWSHEQ